MNFFMEIAKLRAARLLWARLVRPFGPRSDKSLALRTHCQTSGWSLTAQDVFNNVIRTTVEAMAATQGGTQSLHTNALDEALALPTDFAARIARNTQLLLQLESGTSRVIDPWGGSFTIEKLTHDLAARAMTHIEEIEALGGMAKAIQAGLPKRRIEEAAARTQARIDAGRQTIVGVNRYRPSDERLPDVRQIDNTAVRNAPDRQARDLAGGAGRPGRRRRARRPRRRRARRRQPAGPLCRGGAARATVGEMSDAMERAFGRHQGTADVIAGVYGAEAGTEDAPVRRVLDLTGAFVQDAGAKPRLLVAKVGQDGHDRGQKVIASAFADLGFEVVVGPLFATPEEVAARPSPRRSTSSACRRWPPGTSR